MARDRVPVGLQQCMSKAAAEGCVMTPLSSAAVEKGHGQGPRSSGLLRACRRARQRRRTKWCREPELPDGPWKSEQAELKGDRYWKSTGAEHI
jgi:hypothetical protein